MSFNALQDSAHWYAIHDHESLKTFPIRLLHKWNSEGSVSLRIQNMRTGQASEISRLLQADSEYFL